MNKKKGIAIVAVVVLAALPFFMLLTMAPEHMVNNEIEDDEDLSPNDSLYGFSTISNVTLYNVTYANVTYGHNTTTIWETDAMDDSDNTNASFLEDVYATSGGYLFGDITTDDAANWAVNNRFDNLGVSTTEYYVGTKSIEFQAAANSGDGYFELNNNTVRAMNADVSDYNSQNFSIKSTSPTMTLEYAEMYNELGKYYLLDFNSLVIGTSWRVVGGSRAQATSVGGMTSVDPVNYIHWHFGNLDNNEWVYFDVFKVYSNVIERELSVSYNFTSIAAFDHYALNVSAATNMTSEAMEISGHFDEAAVYDIDSATWDNFSIKLNTTKAVAQTYFNVFINNTGGGSHNSTLDIDLFQIYAWNETDNYPVINDAVLTNPDDTDNLYAGYKEYLFTVNVSDDDGFGDIDYVRIAFESPDEQYYWKAGFQEDTGVFIEELYPGNITLETTSTNVSGSNYLNITFAITIEIAHGTVSDFRLGVFVNDTASNEDHTHFALGYDTEVNIDVANAVVLPSEGPGGTLVTITGEITYFDSTLIPSMDYYDIWFVSMNSTIQLQVTEWDTDTGLFTGVFQTGTTIGTEAIAVGAQTEGGEGRGGTCLCHDVHYVYFEVMGGGDAGEGGEDDFWEDWWAGWDIPEDDMGFWIFIFIIFIIMFICCGIPAGCCRGERVPIRLPSARMPKIKAPSLGRVGRGRGISAGGVFGLIKRGTLNGKVFVSMAKSIMRAFKF